MSSANIESVRKLVDVKNSCIVKCHKRLQLLVLPLYFNNLPKGVRVALEQLSVGYCEELGGMILGYENVKIVEGSGWLHSTNPYIHIFIEGTFYVFAPTKGLRIQAVVNEVSINRVSFLAYAKYNVVYTMSFVMRDLSNTDTDQLSVEQLAAGEAQYQYLQEVNKKIKEGETYTLLLQEVAFRDFLPHLRGYPVIDGFDESIVSAKKETLSRQSFSNTPARKVVRFSDEDSETSELADSKVPVTPNGLKLDSKDLNNHVEDELDCEMPDATATPSALTHDTAAFPAIPSPTKKKKKSKNKEKLTVKPEIVKEELLSPPKPSLCNSSSDESDKKFGVNHLKKLIKNGMLPPSIHPAVTAASAAALVKEEVLTDVEGSSLLKKKKKKKKGVVQDSQPPALDSSSPLKGKKREREEEGGVAAMIEADSLKPKKKKRKLAVPEP